MGMTASMSVFISRCDRFGRPRNKLELEVELDGHVCRRIRLACFRTPYVQPGSWVLNQRTLEVGLALGLDFFIVDSYTRPTDLDLYIYSRTSRSYDAVEMLCRIYLCGTDPMQDCCS